MRALGKVGGTRRVVNACLRRLKALIKAEEHLGLAAAEADYLASKLRQMDAAVAELNELSAPKKP